MSKKMNEKNVNLSGLCGDELLCSAELGVGCHVGHLTRWHVTYAESVEQDAAFGRQERCGGRRQNGLLGLRFLALDFLVLDRVVVDLANAILNQSFQVNSIQVNSIKVNSIKVKFTSIEN